MLIIEKIKPASQEYVSIYRPYYPKEKQRQLPYAISLYQQGSLEGIRRIEGGDSIPFVAFWNPENLRLPSASNPCSIQFNSKADLTYRIFIRNENLIGYLLDLILNYKREGLVDFPKQFYQEIMRF